jgi:carbonic anhydrase
MMRPIDMPLAPSRRGLLSMAGLGAVAALAGLPKNLGAASHDKPKTTLTPDQALKKLRIGNARFAADPDVCLADLAGRRAAVTAAQAPWATIIACADSRVPPELLFGGVGLGELFVARNAGNLADQATIGTVEYGAAVLGSPLILVLGHSNCGAVAAACDVLTEDATYPGNIGPMVEPIVPAAITAKGQPGDFLANTVAESARRTVRRLLTASQLLAQFDGSGKIRIVAGVYDLGTGKVTLLD